MRLPAPHDFSVWPIWHRTSLIGDAVVCEHLARVRCSPWYREEDHKILRMLSGYKQLGMNDLSRGQSFASPIMWRRVEFFAD